MRTDQKLLAYRLGRRVANVALGAWVLLSLAALCALAAMVAGCGWRATMGQGRVTWTQPTEAEIMDAHAEDLFPVAFQACRERKECR